MSKIEVTALNAEGTFRRWLLRGDAIGVFTNMALDSSDLGRQVFIPLDTEEADDRNINKMHAPDGPHGTGWKYLLTSIERSIDAFEFKDPEPEPEPVKKSRKR